MKKVTKKADLMDRLVKARKAIGLPEKMRGAATMGKQSLSMWIGRYERLAKHDVDQIMQMTHVRIATYFVLDLDEAREVYNFIHRVEQGRG